MSAEWDNFIYFTNDYSFIYHINKGISEPYSGGVYNSGINIVKRFLNKYPERNRVMLDVGAHIGTTMLPYSRLFSQVYGFEPHKENYEFCVKNINYNKVKNCIVENCAILNKKTFGTSKQHNNCNSGCFYFEENETGIESKVLDEDERFKNIDFIKIDTEGAEYFVILGALNIIKTYKPLLQVEKNGLCEKNFNIQTSQLLELLDSLNYVNIEGTEFFYNKDYPFE